VPATNLHALVYSANIKIITIQISYTTNNSTKTLTINASISRAGIIIVALIVIFAAGIDMPTSATGVTKISRAIFRISAI